MHVESLITHLQLEHQRGPHLETSQVAFRRLLVAIDDSAQAPDVIRAAIKIANSYQSELIFAHAVNPYVMASTMQPIPAETFHAVLEAARTAMHQRLQAEPSLASLPHREVVLYGEPVSVLRDIATAQNVDLVIAGSHGARGLERLVLGSVAEALLRLVLCPVMIIGPRACCWPNPFRSILVAADVETPNLRAAQYATGLALRFQSRLMLLHVIEAARKAEGFDLALATRISTRALDQMVPAAAGEQLHASICVEHGDPAETIIRIARLECVSLLVTGLPRESPLGDHTPHVTLSRIIRDAPCPVLCVRPHLA